MSMKVCAAAHDYFISKVKSNLKIRIPEKVIDHDKSISEVDEKVEKIFEYINFFNSLPEDTTIIDCHPIEDWKILNEFKDFIIPNSIRYESGNRTYVDLLCRSSSDLKPSFNDYSDLISRFRNFFKKDANDQFVTLASLRINRSFEEVRQLLSISGRVRYMDNPYIPIEVNNEIVCLFSDYYFNSDVEQIVQHYVANLQLV